jgi:O-acetyl-ADP-ribose deacetylase
VLLSRPVLGGTLEVVHGDLTLESVDAIVNAANSALAHGGGIAGAIVLRGGDEIQAESYRLAPVPVGGAAVTGAGRLACRHVIHAVGPVWGEGDEEAKLRRAVRSALARAEELGLASVSVPAISTGIFGYPKAAGCRVIADEVRSWLTSTARSVTLVRLVAIDEETASHLLEAAQAL